jgi:hypothetical protein
MKKFKQIIDSFIKENSDIDPNEININVNEIMNDAANSNEHLYNKTINELNAEIFEAVGQDNYFYEKLKNNYRLINDIEDLHIGKYIRWFKFSKTEVDENNEPKLVLSNGAIFIGFETIISDDSSDDGDDGDSIDTKNESSTILKQHRVKCRIRNFSYSFLFEDTIIFQKLSMQELIVLQFGGRDGDGDDSDHYSDDYGDDIDRDDI